MITHIEYHYQVVRIRPDFFVLWSQIGDRDKTNVKNLIRRADVTLNACAYTPMPFCTGWSAGDELTQQDDEQLVPG